MPSPGMPSPGGTDVISYVGCYKLEGYEGDEFDFDNRTYDESMTPLVRTLVGFSPALTIRRSVVLVGRPT